MEFTKIFHNPILFRIFHLKQKLLPPPKDYVPTMDSYTRLYYFKNRLRNYTNSIFAKFDNIFVRKNTFSPIIYSRRKGYRFNNKNIPEPKKVDLIIPLIKD